MNVTDTHDRAHEEWLTAREAAELLPTVGALTVQRWARTGRVPAVRLPNGRWLFRRSDVEALLAPAGGRVA